MKPLTDNDPMPFGTHEGKFMKDIPCGYIDYIYGQTWIDEWPEVKAYIERNEKVKERDKKP